MPINERGEFIRNNEAPQIENPEKEKFRLESERLTTIQDSAPETDKPVTVDKKAEIRRRLLGE